MGTYTGYITINKDEIERLKNIAYKADLDKKYPRKRKKELKKYWSHFLSI